MPSWQQFSTDDNPQQAASPTYPNTTQQEIPAVLSPRDRKVFDAFAAIARLEILREFPKRANCIESTLITVEVLRHFDIKAVAMAVKLGVYPTNPRGHGVSIGGIDGIRHSRGLWKGSFAAHLIAVVPAKRLLIDSSVDQVELPGFQAPCPLILPVHECFCNLYQSIAYPHQSAEMQFSTNLPGFSLWYSQDRIPAGVKRVLYLDDGCIGAVKAICDFMRERVSTDA